MAKSSNKTQKFDEEKWPELTAFRDACIADDYDEMQRIAAREYHWYENENPDDLPMEELARIFQAQWYAQIGDLVSLQQVVAAYPWTANRPWTAQGWLPLSQAAQTHGCREMVSYLIDNGADPTLSVGSPDDRATIVEVARYGENHELADWLLTVIDARDSG
ncbi:MAG: ankyrin repeat domain-containing protein [Woeseiaceae bacterium]